MTKPTTPPHTHRTFGRTTSRLDATTLDKLAARLKPFALQKSDFTQFDKAELEVGMGNGLALFARAKAAPNTLFIGSEVYQNGLRSLVNAIEKHNAAHPSAPLTNIRITSEDARTFMASLPPHSLNRICLLYPDPWPKARHRARRIFTPDFITSANTLLKQIPTAELFVATDIPDYALHTLTTAYQDATFTPTAINPQQWATAPSWWQPTKYEAKAAREGRHPFYLTFIRTADHQKINHNLKTKAD